MLLAHDIALMTLGSMFYMSSSFNENLYWDMRKAKDISFMFAEASSFNGDVSSWQLFSVEKMMNVFEGAVRMHLIRAYPACRSILNIVITVRAICSTNRYPLMGTSRAGACFLQLPLTCRICVRSTKQ
jgi:Mycoplasma protein of unknown function, DUF285